MGKLITMITTLVFIDILLLVTGQIDLASPTSVITGAILDPTNFKTSAFFILFLGIAGILGLASTSGVTTGALVSATNVLAFTAMAVAMTALLGDFITLYLNLRVFNEVLALIIMAPIIMVFAMTLAEWLRGKD